MTTEHTLSFADAFRTLLRSATPPRRRLFVANAVLMLIGAVAELATIGAVLPFLALVTDPRQASNYPLLADAAWIFGGGQDALVFAGAAILVVIAVCAGLIRLALTWVNLRFILLYGHDMGLQIFGRLLRQPYGDFVTRNSSVALASIDKLNTVVFGLLMPVMQGAAAAIIASFIIAGLFFIDPVAASIAGLSLAATYLLVSFLTKNRLEQNSVILGTASTDRIRVVQEGLGGLRDILIDNSQTVYEDAFADLDYRYRSALVVNNIIALAPRYLVETAVMVMIAVITVYFAQLPGGLIAAVPVLGALAIGAQRLMPLVHLAYNGWAAFTGNRQLMVDIAELLQLPVLRSAGTTYRAEPLPFSKAITLNKVSFHYKHAEPALQEVSLSINQGERIGFVGQTGSGKSTLTDLLMGLLPPSAGIIDVDGVVLTEDNVARWQAQIAHVPQSIYLSDGTVAANIAFGVPPGEIDIGRVREAALRAGLKSFIERLPAGFSSSVGERGVRLSGGQRQRIGIARALYKGAGVLVFDEATSALDEKTEAAVMESIYSLERSVTLLMIAHRLSTLAGCDRIVRLEEGQLVSVTERTDPTARVPHG